jgi:hypothetical protein
MVKGVWPTFYFLSSHSFQPRRRAGYTIQVVHACATACFLPVNHSHFTLPTITPPCLGGLRAWKPSFVNGGCGQNGGWLLSAQTSIAPLVALIAAAGGSFSHSPISKVKGHSCRSLLRGCGHICDFYPKYHCELNFIEQYWGTAKVSIPCSTPANHSCRYGEDCTGIP